MIAVLSDIHANLESLEAVLADLAGRPVAAVYCLGDTLGYGPDPVACLDRVMRMDLVLLGNHDHAVSHEPDGFCQSSERAVFFHQSELERTRGGPVGYHDFLGRLLPRHEAAGVLFVHGSPRDPLNDYVFPESVDNLEKMAGIAATMPPLCFCGHTHVPGVFVERRPGEWEYHSPADCGDEWRPDGRKTIFNIGSVGQPRDGDPRAGYVLWDGETARFVRVGYDVAATIRKVHRSPDLDDFLGDRLREGR